MINTPATTPQRSLVTRLLNERNTAGTEFANPAWRDETTISRLTKESASETIDALFKLPLLVDGPPMTPAQEKFISTLLAERDLTDTKYAGFTEAPRMTRVQAHESIDALLDLPTLKVAERCGEGVYFLNGRVFKVKVAVHGSGRLYAQELDPETGRWSRASGMVNALTEENRMTPEQAAEFGRLYGVCALCGRTLTDEESIARGIGPVCAGKL